MNTAAPSLVPGRTLGPVALLTLALVASLVRPQAAETAPLSGHPGQASEATTPAAAARGYVEACRRGDWPAASAYFNLDQLPEVARRVQGPRLARHLMIVLDRRLPLHYERLSHSAEGDAKDGLPEGVDRLGTIGGVEILLERLDAGEGRTVWRFAASSVNRVPELYARFGYGPLGEYLPAWMFEAEFVGVWLWQWVGLALAALAGALLAWVAERLVSAVARRLARRTETLLDDELIEGLRHPTRAIMALALFTLGTLLLVLTPAAYRVLFALERVLAVLAVAWFMLTCVKLIGAGLTRRLVREGRKAEAAVLPLGTQVVSGFIIILSLIAMMQSLGWNVTGILAGLGVGGLAVALAAQKSIANLFGGVSLIADQPVRVGDVCRFADGQMGTVEAIGLRSTRLRTLDRTLVTIPNAEFSEYRLENFGSRDRIRLHLMLGLRCETTTDQLRFILAELRKLLAAHPRVDQGPGRSRVRLNSLSASAFEVELQAFVETTDWSEFLGVREDLLLRILDLLAASGSGLALPSQTLYLGRDGGLDAARAREAERQVGAWRESGNLPFPELPPTWVAELAGTLDYPPAGSPGARR